MSQLVVGSNCYSFIQPFAFLSSCSCTDVDCSFLIGSIDMKTVSLHQLRALFCVLVMICGLFLLMFGGDEMLQFGHKLHHDFVGITKRETWQGNFQSRDTWYISRDACKPHHHVMFLKTHKTGSSTITNILNRFAEEKNLTIALPQSGSNVFWWPNLFSNSSVDRNSMTNGYPDILCNHARYQQTELEALMPRDTSFITILRNPVSNFESVFYYMEIAQRCGITSGDNLSKITKFLDEPEENLAKLQGSGTLINNGQLFDLGFNPEQMKNDSLIQQHIVKIAERFQLVMILEYIDESLVLMKRKLCWSLQDVAYFQFLKSATKRKGLPAEIREKIRKQNRADVQLYEHFNKTFWKNIRAEGEGFYSEVKQLVELREKLRVQCIGNERVQAAFAQDHSKVTRFEIRTNISGPLGEKCCRMLREEPQYIFHHRLRQTPGWSKFLPNFKCRRYETGRG